MGEEFETLLCGCKGAVERFVRFRTPSAADADDILQEVYLTAYRRFDTLRDKNAMKAWMLSIARNKCKDFFRERAKMLEIPLSEFEQAALSDSRFGPSEADTVHETLELLGDREKQILHLYYFKMLPQTEIARQLGVPLGTVKSRLYAAKARFKQNYPYPPLKSKGEPKMKKLPEFMPEYKIVPYGKEPFSVKWEEIMGWFLIPRLGEKLSWGMYDMPSRACSHVYDMEITGRAEVHGIEGVELTARESQYSGKKETINRTFVAQLTDTHCRILASFRTVDGVRKYITFLDEDAFLPSWGFGDDNCGNETDLAPKGDILREGNRVTTVEKSWLLDIVGRYTVTIAGKAYDTVCMMVVEPYDTGVVSEQFLDKNGRTILWRRFNRDDWRFVQYGKLWSEQLPENDRLIVNGTTYVQWYDCITDYIL
jgi:RNA polymerase sigma factor, sigma-70 family